MEGATQCARFLNQLRVVTNKVTNTGGVAAPTAQVATVDRIASMQPQETAEEEMETAEEIMTRQVALT